MGKEKSGRTGKVGVKGVGAKGVAGLVKVLVEGARVLSCYDGVIPARLLDVESGFMEGMDKMFGLGGVLCEEVRAGVEAGILSGGVAKYGGTELEAGEVLDWWLDAGDVLSETVEKDGDVGMVVGIPMVVGGMGYGREVSREDLWSMENALRVGGVLSGEVRGFRLLGRVMEEDELREMGWGDVRRWGVEMMEQMLDGEDELKVSEGDLRGRKLRGVGACGVGGVSRRGLISEGGDGEIGGSAVEADVRGVMLVGLLRVRDRDVGDAFERDLNMIDMEMVTEVFGGVVGSLGGELVVVGSPQGFSEDLRKLREMSRESRLAQCSGGVLEIIEGEIEKLKKRKAGKKVEGGPLMEWRVRPTSKVGERGFMVDMVMTEDWLAVRGVERAGAAILGSFVWEWFEWEDVQECLGSLEEIVERYEGVVELDGEMWGWELQGGFLVQ